MGSKMLYISDENLINLSKVENMSGLVNDLLSKYFKEKNINSLSKEEIKRLIAIEELKIKQTQ